ncbi:hypothetical protein QE152_g26719 [Popillia japonica]|uniref:Uncharacterized protein n=1 Tax=Popillia japonica TaxID=7064 RepID=A0AAW1JY06_POPJA
MGDQDIQGSVERGNSAVKDPLIAWVRDYMASSWSCGLGFERWGINNTYHEAIKMQPYGAMFGKIEGISNGILEENMNELLNQPTETNVTNSELNKISEGTNLEDNNLLKIAEETEILMNQFIEHSREENTEITRTIHPEESFNERLPINHRDNS